MKQFLFFSLIFLLFACEEVVDVDLPTIEPRLVVEADILKPKGQSGNEQHIHLHRSQNYFDETNAPAVTNAVVTITNTDSGEVFPFTHSTNGHYTTSTFQPEFGATYMLTISVDGEQFEATEQFVQVPTINRFEQNMASGFDGEEVISIDFYFNDNANATNFYHVSHRVNQELEPYISIWDDRFQNGNEIKVLYREYFTDDVDGELVAGDEVDVLFSGISENYARYMVLLTEQSYSGGDPFATTPVQLKGNVLNKTNPQHRAFGYFRLSEVVDTTFTVQ